MRLKDKPKRYTVYAVWDGREKGRPSADGSIEEIDVDAPNPAQARKRAAEQLAKDYKPGWRIFRVTYRYPGVMYL